MSALNIQGGIPDWKWLTEALRGDYQNAMRPNNPGLRSGSSRSGPFVRFVKAIAPLLTGEHPQEETIAKHFQRNSRAR
jgi:hypothetical protein